MAIPTWFFKYRGSSYFLEAWRCSAALIPSQIFLPKYKNFHTWYIICFYIYKCMDIFCMELGYSIPIIILRSQYNNHFLLAVHCTLRVQRMSDMTRERAFSYSYYQLYVSFSLSYEVDKFRVWITSAHLHSWDISRNLLRLLCICQTV